MTAKGFFAIGPKEWAKACELGLNPAVALLVLARGSGRDNTTTAWSAEAVAQHTGISWRRAQAAIHALESAKLATVEKLGARPRRKIAIPKDLEGALWLPNTLIDGAGKEVPPVTRLRQAQNLEHLQAFIELYGLQDLAGDGGLPRNLIYAPFGGERICDTGQFTIWGFNPLENGKRYCRDIGPLKRFAERKVGNEHASWDFLKALERMGLLETVHYLAEGDSPDAELLHALTGDDKADEVRHIAELLPERMPEWFGHRTNEYQYVLPVIRDFPAPAVVGISQLVYRPHTKLTAAWYLRHCEACERSKRVYAAIANGDFNQAIAA